MSYRVGRELSGDHCPHGLVRGMNVAPRDDMRSRERWFSKGEGAGRCRSEVLGQHFVCSPMTINTSTNLA